MESRKYQQEALTAVDAYLRQETGNPLVVIPTGGGKSYIMAEIIRKYTSLWSDTRIMNAVHTKELVEQNRDELKSAYDGDIATYSAGLGAKELHANIVFAGVQSVYRASNLGHYDLLFIDEAHRVSQEESSMYQQLISKLMLVNPNLRVIGFTATPYRMGSGKIYGARKMFQNVAYEASVKRLIDEGYLSRVVARGGKQKIDTSNLVANGKGDYTQGSLSIIAHDHAITMSACKEIAHVGLDFNKPREGWVIFCVNKLHAEYVKNSLISDHSIHAEVLTDDTSSDLRAQYIADFKAKKLRCLINVNILTEGFDAPHIDLIALLRPTKSVGLYYQMVGRGLRKAAGKTDCLIMDFAGNVSTHGCIDNLSVPDGKSGRPGVAPTRECPECQTINPIQLKECVCGFEYPTLEREINHNAYASESALLSDDIKPEWHDIQRIDYMPHVSKKTKKNTLRVIYSCGLRKINEWVCVEHTGYARKKAEQWWATHGGLYAPATVSESLMQTRLLNKPKQIKIVRNGKHENVVDYKF